MLENEIIDQAAESMARDIDREVLWGFLTQIGWTRVIIQQNYNLVIDAWLHHNCKGAYEHHNKDFIFEDVKDANWFILRWSS